MAPAAPAAPAASSATFTPSIDPTTTIAQYTAQLVENTVVYSVHITGKLKKADIKPHRDYLFGNLTRGNGGHGEAPDLAAMLKYLGITKADTIRATVDFTQLDKGSITITDKMRSVTTTLSLKDGGIYDAAIMGIHNAIIVLDKVLDAAK